MVRSHLKEVSIDNRFFEKKKLFKKTDCTPWKSFYLHPCHLKNWENNYNVCAWKFSLKKIYLLFTFYSLIKLKIRLKITHLNAYFQSTQLTCHVDLLDADNVHFQTHFLLSSVFFILIMFLVKIYISLCIFLSEIFFEDPWSSFSFSFVWKFSRWHEKVKKNWMKKKVSQFCSIFLIKTLTVIELTNRRKKKFILKKCV